MTSEFTWTPDSGAKQTITAPVDQLMTDVGDGTYTYSFSVQIDGALTMIIKLVDASGVYATWYPNTSFSEPNEKINITANIYFSDHGINWVSLPNGDDYFTAIFYFTLKPPTTDTCFILSDTQTWELGNFLNPLYFIKSDRQFLVKINIKNISIKTVIQLKNKLCIFYLF